MWPGTDIFTISILIAGYKGTCQCLRVVGCVTMGNQCPHFLGPGWVPAVSVDMVNVGCSGFSAILINIVYISSSCALFNCF